METLKTTNCSLLVVRGKWDKPLAGRGPALYQVSLKCKITDSSFLFLFYFIIVSMILSLYISTLHAEPSQQECGNGIVEGDEECDCKYNETMLCESIDPCCRPGECKLWDWAECRLCD